MFLFHTALGSSYPSAPIRINTRNERVGTVYLIFTDFSDMESLTSIIYPVFSFFDLLLTSEWLTRQLGALYDLFCVSYQFFWHIQRIVTERSLTSIASYRDWRNENSNNFNRHGYIIGLIAFCIACYFLISFIMSDR